MLDALMWLADLFYLLGSTLWQVFTIPSSVYFQPDIYGVSYVGTTAPFQGTTWSFALNNFNPDTIGGWLGQAFFDAIATLANWLSIPPETPLLGFMVMMFVALIGVIVLLKAVVSLFR